LRRRGGRAAKRSGKEQLGVHVHADSGRPDHQHRSGIRLYQRLSRRGEFHCHHRGYPGVESTAGRCLGGVFQLRGRFYVRHGCGGNGGRRVRESEHSDALCDSCWCHRRDHLGFDHVVAGPADQFFPRAHRRVRRRHDGAGCVSPWSWRQFSRTHSRKVAEYPGLHCALPHDRDVSPTP